MTSSSASSTSGAASALHQNLVETNRKVEASLQSVIAEHVRDFAPSDGLDFLNVKNGVLLTYLIELTFELRQRLIVAADDTAATADHNDNNNNEPDENEALLLHRLVTLRTILDKMRGLDKKLRYQIDKLLAAGASASSFAATGAGAQEDPLQFRPNAGAMDDDHDDDDDSDSSSGSESESDANSDEHDDDERDGRQGDKQTEEEEDDDLKAARLTVAMSRDKKRGKSYSGSGGGAARDNDGDDDDDDDGVYRAPRLAATPYTHDQEDRRAEQDKRQRRRARASELAATLRAQYGEAPEQEDAAGGGDFGRQREAARRAADRQAAKTAFEEDAMVRLVTTRKEKKERARLMREEKSNLGAIADLGNIVMRGSGRGGDDDESDDGRGGIPDGLWDAERHSSGKRKRREMDKDGREVKQTGRKSLKANNALQAALFGGQSGGGGGKKKKKRGKR